MKKILPVLFVVDTLSERLPAQAGRMRMKTPRAPAQEGRSGPQGLTPSLRLFHCGAALLFIFLSAFLAPVFAFAATATITEIMYDLDGSDTDREWIELQNTGAESVTIKGGTAGLDSWRIYHKTSAGVESNKTIAVDAYQGTMTLEPGSYAVVVQNGDTFKSDYPSYVGTIFVSTALNLVNTSMTVGLRLGATGVPWSLVDYSSTLGANDDGNSLQLVGTAWQAKAPTPGAAPLVSSGSSTPTTTASSTPADVSSSDTSSDSESESAPSVSASSGGRSGEAYWPLEPEMYARVRVPRAGVAGADMVFEADALGKKKEPLINARFLWSFGDGGMAEGKKVVHAYHYPAAYVVMVEVSSGGYNASDRKELIITAPELSISRIREGADGFIEVTNNGKQDVDLSHWYLKTSLGNFLIPQGTLIAAKHSIPFPAAISNLWAEPENTTLLYPNATLAVSYVKVEPQPEVVREQTKTPPQIVAVIEKSEPETIVPEPTGEPERKETPKDGGDAASGQASSTTVGTELIGAVGAAGKGSTTPWLLGVTLLIAISIGGYALMLRPRPEPSAADVLREEAATFDIIE
ncbi:MAG: PKD domain-containing protein [bacterium]|nr:PKD domain-containing protein [bacterium]